MLLSRGNQILWISIKYDYITCKFYVGVNNYDMITHEDKILFKDIGYDHFNILEELNGFAIALQNKLGNDYNVSYHNRESTRHDSDIYTTYNGQPDVPANIHYKYSDLLKPQLRSTYN